MAARLTWDISAYWISVTLLVDMCRLSHEQQNVCLNYLCHLECSVSQGSSTNYQIFVFYLAFCLQPSAENAWFQLDWWPELFFVATSTRLYQILNIKTGQFQTACSCTFTFSYLSAAMGWTSSSNSWRGSTLDQPACSPRQSTLWLTPATRPCSPWGLASRSATLTLGTRK